MAFVKLGGGGEVLPSRDSARIVKLVGLTMQRFGLFLNYPNISPFFFAVSEIIAKFATSFAVARQWLGGQSYTDKQAIE